MAESPLFVNYVIYLAVIMNVIKMITQRKVIFKVVGNAMLKIKEYYHKMYISDVFKDGFSRDVFKDGEEIILIIFFI